MSHIVVFMLWEAGHLLPTMKLSRDLVRRGHRVTYVTIPDLVGFVNSRGLDAVPILAEYFPPGSQGRIEFWPEDQRLQKWAALEQSAHDEVVEQRIESLQADLVMVDSLFFRTYAEALRKRGLQVLIITSSMPHEPKGGAPPLHTPLLPGGGIVNRATIRIEWLKYFADQWWQYFFRRVPMSLPKTSVKTEEMILCAEHFDFPRPARRGRHYVGPSVDLEVGPSPDFPWHRIDSNARLIYFSFGSQAYRYPNFVKIARAVIRAVGAREDEQLVLVAGDDRAGDLGPLPNNVIRVPHAPQIELLRIATVAMTHGGLGTVKECILMGVPMVTFPQCFDQPGNAARIEYHGLGVRCIDAQFDHDEVRRLLNCIYQTPSIVDNVRRMQRLFQSAEQEDRAVKLIEHLLSARRGRYQRPARSMAGGDTASPDSHHLSP